MWYLVWAISVFSAVKLVVAIMAKQEKDNINNLEHK